MYCGGQPIFLLFCNLLLSPHPLTLLQLPTKITLSIYLLLKPVDGSFSLGLPSCDKANTRSDSLFLPHLAPAILGMKAWTSYASSLSIVFDV
jgi:hypothetical protein